MATYQITPPENFSFNRPEEWPKCIRRFERFQQVSDLDTKGEESQINALINTMGDHADDILCSFRLNQEDAKKYMYDVVKGKFDGNFLLNTETSYFRGQNSTNKSRKEVNLSIVSLQPFTFSQNTVSMATCVRK